MPYYVYIIQSQLDGTFYKGSSQHPVLRLSQHNNQECVFTSTKGPWSLVYVEEMESKAAALKRERNLKKADRKRLSALLKHSKNIVDRFI